MNRTLVSLNNDLKILSKYQLVNIFKQANPGHGVHKVIEPTFGSEKIEFNPSSSSFCLLRLKSAQK
jgi:hypothetical protein